MKSKASIDKIKIEKPSASDRISLGEVKSDAAYSQLRAALHFAEENQGKIIFRKKYISGQKRLASWRLDQLRKKRPAIALKDAVSYLLAELPETVTSDIVMEITRHILSEWDNLAGFEAEAAGNKAK